MAERRRSAHAIDDPNNGGTLSAKKPRDPQSSYLYRSVVARRPSRSALSARQGIAVCTNHLAGFCEPMSRARLCTGTALPGASRVGRLFASHQLSDSNSACLEEKTTTLGPTTWLSVSKHAADV